MASQKSIVLEALLHGETVNIQTMKPLGVTRLNQVIDELWSEGYVINSEDIIVEENGKKKHICNHVLAHKPNDWAGLELKIDFCYQRDGSRFVSQLNVYRVYNNGDRVMAQGLTYPNADYLARCLVNELPLVIR